MHNVTTRGQQLQCKGWPLGVSSTSERWVGVGVWWSVFKSANNIFVGVVKTRRRQGHEETKSCKVGNIFTDSDCCYATDKTAVSSRFKGVVSLRVGPNNTLEVDIIDDKVLSLATYCLTMVKLHITVSGIFRFSYFIQSTTKKTTTI